MIVEQPRLHRDCSKYKKKKRNKNKTSDIRTTQFNQKWQKWPCRRRRRQGAFTRDGSEGELTNERP